MHSATAINGGHTHAGKNTSSSSYQFSCVDFGSCGDLRVSGYASISLLENGCAFDFLPANRHASGCLTPASGLAWYSSWVSDCVLPLVLVSDCVPSHERQSGDDWLLCAYLEMQRDAAAADVAENGFDHAALSAARHARERSWVAVDDASLGFSSGLADRVARHCGLVHVSTRMESGFCSAFGG
eukprot:scpid71594/ scgid23246/ 